MSLCPNCEVRPKQKHFNSKWCRPCADGFRSKPRHALSDRQIKEIKKRLHKMPKAQICEEVGCSWSSLGRWASSQGIRVAYFNKYVSNPKLVKDVCEYYGKHGKAKTLEKFPGINLRSIVERYKIFPPRQIRWTDDQLKELARMAGVVSIQSQAKYFSRPRANKGSIKSAWMKKFHMGGGCINGLSWYTARHFVTEDCKPIRTKFWMQRDGIAHNLKGRQVVLWVEMQKHLRSDCPEWIKETVDAMARFQIWLHGTEHVKFKVQTMIRRREIYEPNSKIR